MKRVSASKASKAKRSTVDKSLPAGYTQVSSTDFPDNHDFDKNPICEGTVVDIKTVLVRPSASKKPEERKIMAVADSDGVISAVWESAGLKGLFKEAKKGDQVFIKFVETIALKGRKSMRKFVTGIKPAKGGKTK